jgi:hypothetical protein
MWFMVVMVLIGWAVFWYADTINAMQGTSEAGLTSQFNPFIYSSELFVPLVNLHQKAYWLPKATGTYGAWFQAYFWLHIILGWVSTSLLVAALTGLVRKE